MKYLIKDIMGRLGNILFSYICGLYQAQKQNRELLIKTCGIPEGYLQFVIDNGFLPSDLHYVSEPINCIKQSECASIIYTPIIDLDNDIFVEGYRQSPKYWDNNEQFVWDLIKPQEGVIEKIKEAYKDVDFENTVSINIRRGDYTKQQNINYLGLLNQKYYMNAIEKCGKDKLYLVVSDDINWCKEIFKNYNFIFVEKMLEGVDNIVRDFWIQTLCKENIIANSTFSWWAAYLNKYVDKKIYYPNPWFIRYTVNDKTDIIPNDNRWIKINSEFI